MYKRQVFFHGGGFAWGGTADPLYDGQFFVEENEDIVMVTANYRVGFMGFIDFSRVEEMCIRDRRTAA